MKQEDVDLLANQLPQTDEAAADLRGSDLLNTLKALKTINMNSLKYGNILKVAKVSAAIFFANSDAPQTVFFAAQAAVEAFRAYSQLLPDHEEQACKWLGQAFYLRNNLSDDKKRELERGLMPKFLPLEPQGNVDELKAVARRANLIFGSRCGKALNAHAAYTGWQTHTALCSPEVTRTSWYDAALKRKDALLDPEAQRKLGRVQEVSARIAAGESTYEIMKTLGRGKRPPISVSARAATRLGQSEPGGVFGTLKAFWDGWKQSGGQGPNEPD